MLFYFAVVIYDFLFTTHPKVDLVLKRDLRRAVKQLWTWLPMLSYPKPTHSPGSQFSTPQRSCSVYSPVPEQLFGFPGLSLALNFYCFGFHQPVMRACCYHHPACFSCLGFCGAAPIPVGTEPLHSGCPWPPAPWPWGSCWPAHHLVSEPRHFGPWVGHHKDWSSHSPCCPPDFSSVPRAFLVSHCLQPFQTHWERVQWFLHLMQLILPAFTQGTAGISLFLALRKGLKLDQLQYGAKGVDCDWVTNLYNGRILRRDGYRWCTPSAWSRGQKVITAMGEGNEPEQGNWTGLFSRGPFPPKGFSDSVQKAVQSLLQSQREE